MINVEDISGKFVEQVDYQLSVHQKPNPEYIADYLVSLLPDDISSKLEPVQADRTLLQKANSLKAVFGSLISRHQSNLSSQQLESLSNAYSSADGDLKLISWDSQSVGEVLTSMIRGGRVSTDKVGDTLSQIVEDRINHASERSLNPDARIVKAMRPVLREAVRNLQKLDGFADFQVSAKSFTDQKRGLETQRSAIGYPG